MKDITNGRKLDEMLNGVIGIYALHREGEIVYVGQSHCVRLRIYQHMKAPEKDFDSYSFVNLTSTLERMNYPTGRKYLNWVEAWETMRANPEHNRQIPNIKLLEAGMSQDFLSFCHKVADRGGAPTDADFKALSDVMGITS